MDSTREDPNGAAFAARGLDPEIAAKMGARFTETSKGLRFEFDYLYKEELQFKKLRTLDKKFFLDRSGVRLRLWNLDSLRDLPSPVGAPLVITEGEFDAIAVNQACGGYVVSVPNGVAGQRTEKSILIADDNRFAYLWENEKLIHEVDQFDKIILATDADEPGAVLRDELALRIGETRCWFVTYPDDCKDANDVLQKHGAGVLRRVIEDAKPMRPGYLVRPSEVPPKRFEATFGTGWKNLDPHLQLIRQELMVVTGEPGHGKGQWVRALVCRLAEKHGLRTAILAPEDPAHRINRDLMRFAKRHRAQLNSGRWEWPGLTTEHVERHQAWMDAHFRISSPPEDEPITLEMVEAEMESAALHHNCQIFVLDPWNEVEHTLRNGETETQYIERALRSLKRKMRRLGMILIIVAHPTKLAPGVKATLYSISGSANWRNKADHGIIVYRPEPEGLEIELIVEKSKDHETMGIPGSLAMTFTPMKADYLAGADELKERTDPVTGEITND